MNRTSWLLAASMLCRVALQAAPAMAQLNGATAPVAGEPFQVTARSYPSATQASIVWSSSAAGVTGFRIERRIYGSRAWTQTSVAGALARNAIDSNLLLGTAYEYRVSALFGDGSAQASAGQVILRTPDRAGDGTDYTLAGAPRRVTAQPMNNTEVAVEWLDATPDEIGFRVERLDPGADWRVVDMVAANALLYRDRSLQAGVQYQYRVTAVRADGSAYTSLPVAVTTPAAGVTNVFYVDAATGNDWNAGTEARPWQTLQKAHDAMTPGQTVLVRRGTYTNQWNYTVLQIYRSGAPGAPVTYRNYPGERPLIKTIKGVNHHGIEARDASWLVIDGFEIEGHVKQVSYAEAKEQNDLALAYSKMNPQRYIGATVDSNGISVIGRVAGSKPHHIQIRNNYVHDVPGGGISVIEGDYVTVEHNRTTNTSSYSPYGTSGISYLTPYNFDTNTSTYRLMVMNNVVTEASNLFPCNCYNFIQPTDGNGIILDTFDQHTYTGRSLVANNIVYNNGGRGIHAFHSSFIDVFGNTLYRNSTIAITGEGEISMQNVHSARIFNNILVASPGPSAEQSQ